MAAAFKSLEGRAAALHWSWVAALAAGAGALAALGFAPREWIACSFAGIAILYLLAARTRHPFVAGYAFGIGHFALGLDWIAKAFTYQSAMAPAVGWAAVAVLTLYLALFPAVAAWAARRIAAQRPLALALALAGTWTVAELLRGTLLTGFPWNPLGAAWLAVPPIAGAAAWVGATGLSLLLVLAAAGVGAAAVATGWARLAGLGAPLLLGAGLALPPSPSPAAADDRTLLLIQPGTGQDARNLPGGAWAAVQTLARQTMAALARSGPVAAVIWPEAAVDFPLNEDPELARLLGALLPERTLLLTGAIALQRGPDQRATGAYNSLYVLNRSGAILARYDKAHLVPGGEYLPLRAVLEPLGLSRLVPGSIDFLPGPGPRTFQTAGLAPFGPVICYEIIFADRVIDREQRPQWILNVSSDAWFGPSGPPQHFAQSRLRAIEEGLPVVRVTPTGISGLIGPDGHVLRQLRADVADSALVRLPAALPPTPYARLGQPLPTILALACIGAGALLRRRKT
jgi:apolipoprotein N-acyltransferase